MTRVQAEEFVQLVHDEIGRFPAVYGGGLMRTKLANVKTSVLSSCPLWHQRYAPTPKGIPKIWTEFTLWQYTDGKSGPQPRVTDGISAPAGVADRNRYDGTETQLRERWPFR
jgi:lysozyme